MTTTVLASGVGYSSLQQAAQQIAGLIANEQYGTQYEMAVTINAPGWMIRANLAVTNSYLSNHGVKPWPGQKVVAYQDNTVQNVVRFQWTK